MALDLIAELEAIVDAFDRSGIEYALCGGLALGLHGYPRATMDIDLLLRAERLADAIEVGRTVGFDIPSRKMVRSGTPREIQRISKLDPKTNDLMSLDLILVGTALEDVWAGRTAFDVQGRRMIVVSRDGLATMKRIAGRPQDLVDLAKLEGTTEDRVATFSRSLAGGTTYGQRASPFWRLISCASESGNASQPWVVPHTISNAGIAFA